MQFKTLGDWCKWLENNFSNEIMIPTLPTIVRLDGVGFHKWAKNLNKPYDENLSTIMVETTKKLVNETSAVIGYTQSDEITLLLYQKDKGGDIYHGGKKQKILSKLTGKCVTFFNELRQEFLPEHNVIANFDCRIYQTPTLHDACIQFLWRENDAVKNSISMLARSMFSHEEVFGFNSTQLQDKMFLEKGVNWDSIESRFKRGVYVRRVSVEREFTKEELERLPESHVAHSDPTLTFKRNQLVIEEFPILNKISNKIDVIFNSASPILYSEKDEN